MTTIAEVSEPPWSIDRATAYAAYCLLDHAQDLRFGHDYECYVILAGIYKCLWSFDIGPIVL